LTKYNNGSTRLQTLREQWPDLELSHTRAWYREEVISDFPSGTLQNNIAEINEELCAEEGQL
jgi:hypothetical protein